MTDKEIVKRAKEAEKRTGFGELVHSPISKGVNSAYGIGFIEGMVEYRNSLQEEPVSEDKMTISKEWFEHCKKSWYNEGYIDGEYNRDRQFEEPVSEELEDFAKRQADEFAEREYEVDSYDRGCLSKGYYWGCKAGAKWQLAKIKSITLDDLGEFINELSKQFPEVSFAKVCKIATRTAKWLLDVELLKLEED